MKERVLVDVRSVRHEVTPNYKPPVMPAKAKAAGQILIDPVQPEALTTRNLEAKMRIRHVELPDTKIENFPNHLLHVVGLNFRPHSPTTPQEFAFIGDVRRAGHVGM